MAARKTSTTKRKSAARKKVSARAGKKPKASRAKKPARKKRVPIDEPYPFHEVFAVALFGICVMFLLSLVSYSPADLPTWVPFSSQAGQNNAVGNFIGPVGAVTAGRRGGHGARSEPAEA